MEIDPPPTLDGSIGVPSQGSSNTLSLDSPKSLGPMKPITPPKSSSRSSAGTGRSGSRTASAAPHSIGKAALSQSRPMSTRKTFTTSRTFPEKLPSIPPAMLALGIPEGGELQRNQRRSKVEAMSKIDRTPYHIDNQHHGPTATSFIPQNSDKSGGSGIHNNGGPSSSSAIGGGVSSGPGVSRNPLHRPKIRNPPFQMETVRTEAPRENPSRSGTRMFGLQECPVYYPTMEEFIDPMKYIESISTEAKSFGICKIVPPVGWRMPFNLDTDTFKFKTRLQRLNSLEATSRAKLNFLDQLTMFHLQQGDSKVSIPMFDRKPLDLWQLRKEVSKLGGYDATNISNAWGNIAEGMGYAIPWATHIKAAYAQIIVPFENFSNRAKSASVSPLTPLSYGNGTTPSKMPPGWMGSGNGNGNGPESPTLPSRMNSRPSRMSGFSAPASLAPKLERRTPPLTTSTSLPPPETPNPNSKIKVPGFSSSASRDGTESELSDDSLTPPPPPTTLKKKAVKEEYQKGEVCEVCRGGHAPEKMLLCDGCDRGFHIYCLDPPLAAVPANEEWYCTPCLLSQGDDYGFEEGEEHSIPSFQARDAAFSYTWWNRHRPGPSSASSSQTVPDPLSRRFGKAWVSEDDVEREFWRLTESGNDTVEVEYGADVHSTTHGSAAPTLETHPLDPYSKDSWNLNNMPILPESLLRYIKSDISGMTVPWIYIGMLFSTFCWHNEDHYTYSINYMYWGETKTWYGIPGDHASKFEDAIKVEAPELFEQQPGLLFQLVTMMNPGKLVEKGVDVVACDQRPNEFVITFPKAYHCGFNHGINFNEAVNFALPDWLQDGKDAVLRYKEHAKPPVFSHNELLITITLYSESIKTALWLQKSLSEMVEEETARRDRLRREIPMLSEILEEEDCPEEQYQCCICKGFCYLSQVTCTCTKLVACVDHARALCNCDTSRRTLRKRYSEAQLEEILAAVTYRASLPSSWKDRFNNLLEVPRPPLKSLRTLLADGEKISYPIPELADLRALIVRANTWVDKVTALVTRKPGGRRRKRQESPGGGDPVDSKSADTLAELLSEVDKLAFDAPEIMQLRQILFSIENFRSEANLIISTPEEELDLEKCKTALILGNSLQVDLPEVAQIQTIVDRLAWFRQVEDEVDDKTIQYSEVVALLARAEACEIPVNHPTMIELRKRESKGKEWKSAVTRLLESDSITLEQLDSLIDHQELTPTTLDVMRNLESIRKTATHWQVSAHSLLMKVGSLNAAQRLVKAYKTANGPVANVVIPDIAELEAELELITTWTTELSSLLGCTPGSLNATLKDHLQKIQGKLDPSDDTPNPEHSCFCRSAPDNTMVQCVSCRGSYHLKCVKVTLKNATLPYRCDMCKHDEVDDRPSLHALAGYADTHRWNFLFDPNQLALLTELLDVCLRFAIIAFTAVDPRNTTGSIIPSMDNTAITTSQFELFTHFGRKLYTLPICFDAVSASTNERAILENWLYKRYTDLSKPPPPKIKRVRKARIILAAADENRFHCICSSPPLDHVLQVLCMWCGQGYHMSCVRAPLEAGGVEKKPWKCPCCCVKQGRNYSKSVELRVQMAGDVGTTRYLDYMTCINKNATAPVYFTSLERNMKNQHVVTLISQEFIPAILPDDYEVKATTTTNTASAVSTSTSAHPAPNGNSHGSSKANGHLPTPDNNTPSNPKRRKTSQAAVKASPSVLGGEINTVEVEVVNAPGMYYPGASTSNGHGPNRLSAPLQATLNGHSNALATAANHYSSSIRPTDVYRPPSSSIINHGQNKPMNTPRSILDQPGRNTFIGPPHPWAPQPRSSSLSAASSTIGGSPHWMSRINMGVPGLASSAPAGSPGLTPRKEDNGHGLASSNSAHTSMNPSAPTRRLSPESSWKPTTPSASAAATGAATSNPEERRASSSSTSLTSIAPKNTLDMHANAIIAIRTNPGDWWRHDKSQNGTTGKQVVAESQRGRQLDRPDSTTHTTTGNSSSATKSTLDLVGSRSSPVDLTSSSPVSGASRPVQPKPISNELRSTSDQDGSKSKGLELPKTLEGFAAQVTRDPSIIGSGSVDRK